MRNLLLILVLVTAGGAVAWMGSTGPRTDGVDAVHTSNGRVEEEVRGAPARAARINPLVEGRTAQGPRASLTVRVIDPKGGDLPQAAIRVDGPGGTLAGEGHEEWSALAPGAYTVAVTHAGYPDWTRTIELEGEQRSRLYVQLREEIELRGQVVDRFGAPIPGQQVWCLAAGQTHPFNVEGARHLLGAVADREGRVKLTLPNGGEWRISIGRVAKQELVGQRRTMAHGGPDRFIAVVGGATRLNLEVQFASDPEPLTAIVLQRREDAVADRGDEGGTSLKDVDDPARQERLEKAFSRGDLEVGPNRIDLGDPGAGPTLPDWVNRMSRSVGNDGRVSFEHLLSGREYRLGVVRSGERYESQTSFVLTPDELLTVRARVPASLGPSDEPLVAPLHISLQHGKPGEQDLEPGIHWQ